MQKEVKCPQCGGNKYQQIDNGVYKCFYCGSTFICSELRIEPTPTIKVKEPHYLMLTWGGISAFFNASIDLEVNGITYNNASLESGFSIKIPVKSTMNIRLSIGLTSSDFSFSLNPNCDYEMNLEYSQEKKWFTSYIVYKKVLNERHVAISGEIEKQVQDTTDLGRKQIVIIIGCTLLLLLLMCIFM